MSFHHIHIVLCDHEDCEAQYELATGEKADGWVERGQFGQRRHYCPAHAAEHHGGAKKKAKGKEAKA